MSQKTLEFTIRIDYDSDVNGVICEHAAKENLMDAIENERVNGALTPDDISATNVQLIRLEQMQSNIK